MFQNSAHSKFHSFGQQVQLEGPLNGSVSASSISLSCLGKAPVSAEFNSVVMLAASLNARKK